MGYDDPTIPMRPRLAIPLVLSLLSVGSCNSATDTIARHATSIGDLARSSEARFINIGDMSGVAEQQQIQALSSRTLLQMPKVGDRETLLDRILKAARTWGVVAAIGGVTFLLFYFGIAQVLRRVIQGFFGRLIPANTLSEAKLDYEALQEPTTPSVVRERVAAKRASDPPYNAAWKRVKSGTGLSQKREAKSDD